jgi:hypothetical protein
MKYLICAVCAIIITMAFSGRKCEHEFTQVEQASVKIPRPCFLGDIQISYGDESWLSYPTGLQEGKELVCVKCFHVQKQMLDYGQPSVGLPLTDWPLLGKGISASDSCLFIKGGRLVFDTSNIIRQ